MFVLKIVIFSSALLNVGFSATQCDPNQIVEFQCQNPTCMGLENKSMEGLTYPYKKKLIIFGFNENEYLVKNDEGKFSIVPRNQLKIKEVFGDHYVFNVTIHKTTFEVCDLSNQPNEENHNDSITAQINTNTENIINKISDNIDNPEVIEDVNIKSLDTSDENINETDSTPSSVHIDVSDEDSDNSLKIEIEDVQNLSNFDKNTAKILVNESLLASSDQIINSDSVDPEIINQNNTTSSQKLKSDSSTKCVLGSCLKDISGQNENIFIKQLSNNISPVKTANSNQQIPNLEKTDSPTEKLFNNAASQNSGTVNIQNDNSDTENLNTESPNQQLNEQIPITKPLPNVEKTDGPTEKSFNNAEPQNSSTVNKQNSNNDTKNLNQQQNEQIPITKPLPNVEKIDSPTEKSFNNAEPQNSSTVNKQNNNNDMKNLNTESLNQQKNEQIPTTKPLPNVEETDNFMDKFNNIAPQNSNTVGLQDNINSTEEFNETQPQKNTNSDSLQDVAKVDNQQGNNNYKQSLEQENIENNNDSNIANTYVLSSGEKLREYNNQSIINETPKQPGIDNGKEIKGDLSIESHDHKVPEFQNTYKEDMPNDESTSHNDPLDDNITHSSPLQKINNETDIASSTDYQTTVDGEVDVTEISSKESIDQCTSESGCEQSMDSISKHSYDSIRHQYKPENKVLPYENVHTSMKLNNNEKSNEFEQKSFVASFGHPDTCSGVNCLNFKRNTEKIIKSSQTLNSVSNPDLDATLHPSDTNFEKENLIDEIIVQSDKELSFFDNFQNLLSSPTLNSIDFLWNIFGKYSNKYNDADSDQTDDNQEMLGYVKHINHSDLYFIVVAVVTLLFSLIYYKYQKGTYENHLLTLLAAKEQNLLIVEKELSLLKEQNSGSTISTTERNLEIETLNDHLIKSEDIITSQALRIEKLEQEVEELTEDGMEMHTLLSSALDSSTKSTDKLNALKVKFVDSENLVAALTQKNFEKITELEKKNDVIKTYRTNIDELTNKNISLIEDNAKISLQLEQVITRNTLKESKLLSEIHSLKLELDKLTNAFLTAENEVLLSKDALQEIMSQKFNPADTNKFSSSIKLSAELKSVKQMCEGYKKKLDEALKSNQQHLDHIDVLKSDISNLEDVISKLEKKKEESVNKLNILTKFFKEQEKEYLKQINEKSTLYDNKECEFSDLHERVKSLNQEIANYKSEIHSLKKEITDQEASFKIQISAADKKASDYWISFRQAERKLKEMELETAQLRNKLTMMDKKLENGTKSIDSSKDFEDELLDIPLPTVSPDFTLLDFEPPPPILTNERLPPLGALGQAPSPPVPLSRRHNRSLSPSSPPPSQRSSVFRPLPQRYNYMNRQNSLGHSVESLDK